MPPPGAPHLVGFEILEQIGTGGMGTVYRARDIELDRLVAIKLLRLGFEGSEPRERFRQEARSAARLDHPNIVRIYSFGEHAGVPYIVMEFLSGATLDRLIQLKQPIALVEKLNMIEMLCAALEYAHSKGVIHRDVKPPNLMITATGVLKILDFGIARALQGSRLTRTHALLGTPNYMSPEQLRDSKTVDTRSDIFALGAVFYELLTYQQAFPGDVMSAMFRVTGSAPARFDHTAPHQDPRLEQIVLRALQKDPNLRYQNLAALLADLHEVRRGLDLRTTEGMTLTEILSASDRGHDAALESADTSPWRETPPIATAGASLGTQDPTQSTPHLERRLDRRGRPGWPWSRWVAGALAAVVLILMVNREWPVLSRVWPGTGSSPHKESSAQPAGKVDPGAGKSSPQDSKATAEHQQPGGTPPVSLRRRVDAALDAGHYDQALEAIRGATPGDPEIEPSLDRLIQIVRDDFDQRRRSFVPTDPKSAAQYQIAAGKRSRAETLYKSGQKLDAAKALLAADGSLQTAAALARRTPPQAGKGPLPTPPEAAKAAETPSQTPNSKPVEPARPVEPSRPAGADVGSPEGGKKPQSPIGEPPANGIATSVPPPQKDSTSNTSTTDAEIREVLRRYQEAYERLDFNALRKVWPRAPEALAAEFANIRSYRLELTDIEINVQGGSARVTCIRRISVQAAVGRPQSTRQRIAITLTRQAQGWVIADVISDVH